MEEFAEEFFDFEIDEDIDIDESLLETENEFENCEIEIPDNINVDDLTEEETLERIPHIQFVDEEELLLSVLVESADITQPLVCNKCGKSYKTEELLR